MRLTRRSSSNTDFRGDIVKVEATLWVNGDGFPRRPCTSRLGT
jgi:hypothetical protein